MAEEPLDRCPYPRPFPAGFQDCPTYAVTLFTAATSRGEPLGVTRTCRFLSMATSGEGRFYPRCALGSADARAAVIASVDQERLEAVRRLRADLSLSLGPSIAAVGAVRARLVEARRSRRFADEADARADLLEAGRAMAEEIRDFFRRRAGDLESAGIPPAATEALVDELLPVLTAAEEVAEFRISDEVIARFPPEARLFLRPTMSSLGRREGREAASSGNARS